MKPISRHLFIFIFFNYFKLLDFFLFYWPVEHDYFKLENNVMLKYVNGEHV